MPRRRESLRRTVACHLCMAVLGAVSSQGACSGSRHLQWARSYTCLDATRPGYTGTIPGVCGECTMIIDCGRQEDSAGYTGCVRRQARVCSLHTSALQPNLIGRKKMLGDDQHLSATARAPHTAPHTSRGAVEYKRRMWKNALLHSTHPSVTGMLLADKTCHEASTDNLDAMRVVTRPLCSPR